jgi:hypothetical protein
MADEKWSAFANGGSIIANDTLVGLRAGVNNQFSTANPFYNNVSEGYTTTVSSATPIVLTVSSNYNQYVTGSTAQTITMPVVSTLVLQQSWNIVSLSTATITVQSSGGNTIATIPPGGQAQISNILLTGTTASSWWAVVNNTNATGTLIAWTPTVTFATPGDLTVSYASQVGYYVFNNGLVNANFIINFTPTFTTASGAFEVTNFPMTSANIAGLVWVGSVEVTSANLTFPVGTTYLTCRLGHNSTLANIDATGTNAITAGITTTSFVSGQAQGFRGSITYFV